MKNSAPGKRRQPDIQDIEGAFYVPSLSGFGVLDACRPVTECFQDFERCCQGGRVVLDNQYSQIWRHGVVHFVPQCTWQASLCLAEIYAHLLTFAKQAFLRF